MKTHTGHPGAGTNSMRAVPKPQRTATMRDSKEAYLVGLGWLSSTFAVAESYKNIICFKFKDFLNMVYSIYVKYKHMEIHIPDECRAWSRGISRSR